MKTSYNIPSKIDIIQQQHKTADVEDCKMTNRFKD